VHPRPGTRAGLRQSAVSWLASQPASAAATPLPAATCTRDSSYSAAVARSVSARGVDATIGCRYRRALAREEMGSVEAAEEDLRQARALLPADRQVNGCRCCCCSSRQAAAAAAAAAANSAWVRAREE
jgi:hypothetical protein